MLATFPDDKQKHFMVAYYLASVITIFGAFNPKVGIIALLILLFLCALWELPKLIKNRFNDLSLSDAKSDFLMAVFAVFPFLVILIITS